MDWSPAEEYSDVVVNVDLKPKHLSDVKDIGRKVLRNFLQNPPSHAFASNKLRLTGLQKIFLNEIDYFLLKDNKPLWKKFVVHWIFKLESLEVDYFDNICKPSRSYVNLLLGSPFLKKLHVHNLRQEFPVDIYHGKIMELPQKIFQVEHLSIDCLRLSSSYKQQFFTLLSRNGHLKTFELKSILLCDLDYLVKFIEATQERSNLTQVTLTMCDSEWTQIINAKEEYLEFALAVAYCKYPISLRQFGGNGRGSKYILEDVLEELKNAGLKDAAEKFCKSLEWIPTICVYSYFTNIMRSEELIQFPNLLRLDNLSTFSWKDLKQNYVSWGEDDEEIKFPEHLLTLGVETGLPGNIPEGLIHLDIMNYKSSVPELLKSLDCLSRRCPLLKSLRMKWSCSCADETEESSIISGMMAYFQQRKYQWFPNLESLTFIAGSEGGDAVLGGILLKGFELPEMSLISLKLECKVDKDMVNQLILGKISESLLHFRVERDLIKDDEAMLAETELKALVAENAKRRMERDGSNVIARDWFDPATWNLDDVEKNNVLKCMDIGVDEIPVRCAKSEN